MLKSRHTEDTCVELGIDEAGRGCLWGPLFAGAVVWPREAEWTEEVRTLSTQVRDSKKLSAKRRSALEEAIKGAAVAWGIGRVEAAEIDEHGMTWANRMAFVRAWEAVREKMPGVGDWRLLVDGTLGLTDGQAGGAQQIVEPAGDATYLAIAAASILAKEGRDRVIGEMVAAEPVLQERYGLLNSKGYGTAVHRAAVKQHGMHAQHRRLFLRKLLGLEHTVSGAGYAFVD